MNNNITITADSLLKFVPYLIGKKLLEIICPHVDHQVFC